MGGVSARGFTPVLNFGFGVMSAMVEELPAVRVCDDEAARVLLAVTGVSEAGTKCDDVALIALHFDLASMMPALDFIPETSVQVLVDDGDGG